ncbi:MAG: hypothetical protein QOJ59_4164, partial [Thermomicrobiales bacterium]|nr:hypothetical protein [Thermomicrobiales bacterium]
MITESQESRSTLSSTAVTGAPDETSFADVRRDWLAIARRNWLATAALVFLVCLGLVAVIPSLFGIPDPLVTTP